MILDKFNTINKLYSNMDTLKILNTVNKQIYIYSSKPEKCIKANIVNLLNIIYIYIKIY